MTTTAASPEKRVACIGECMVEFSHLGGDALKMAFGGDTLNTAVYLARLTERTGISVDYVTALGGDAYSDAMLDHWRDEGVGTDLVTRLENRLPGLYTIRTDEKGERSFTYWRENAAARDLLKDGRDEALAAALEGYDLVYLSGITLSILDPDQRTALLDILNLVRNAGGRVAFDGNFRPAGWPNLENARAWFAKILAQTDIALPTLDDERSLFGDRDADAVAARLHGQGVPEVVVKLGASGCLLSGDGLREVIATTAVERVVDSTAAGDSFNAGYLAARLLNLKSKDAAKVGHHLAGSVIGHHGALIAREAMPIRSLTCDLGGAFDPTGS